MPKAWAIAWLASVSSLASSTRAVAGLDRRLERRGQLAARATPLGPEVDEDRNLARALDHALLEIGLCDVVDHRSEVRGQRARGGLSLVM